MNISSSKISFIISSFDLQKKKLFSFLISCLREIIQNVLEQAHFSDEDDQSTYSFYDPSQHADESLAHEYGGYKSNDTCELMTDHNNNTNNNNNNQMSNVISSEDLRESRQRSTISIHSSSSSSLSKVRYNPDDVPLVYDGSDSEFDENDDDDEFKRSKSSDDKRIYVKELNYVKGRQVGLLIGPFGKFILINLLFRIC